MKEARKPYQWHGDGAAVAQFDQEGVIADLDPKRRGCLCVKRDRIHATPAKPWASLDARLVRFARQEGNQSELVDQ
jgi:hypothetical protein